MAKLNYCSCYLKCSIPHSRNGTAIRNLEEPLTLIGFHRQSENKASSQKNSKNLPPSPTLFNGGSSLKLLGENDESENSIPHILEMGLLSGTWKNLLLQLGSTADNFQSSVAE
ncbi:unnamed protein product [Sphenostylis stenocarpa]|uniref:Uncharacterized protein n=1 Tax=Sphenostylis stenocarpa TaxID=92480 RepID=A0AA86VMI2_9FABA|nr:unnamed protein product [Sphenostylis stenocarpa]